MTTEEEVDAFLKHHGVKGMLKGFPKTNLDRVSRIARGTATKKAVIQKAQTAELKKAEADAAKVVANDKATLVIDQGPTSQLPKVKPPPAEGEDPGESLVKALLKKFGATRVVDLGK